METWIVNIAYGLDSSFNATNHNNSAACLSRHLQKRDLITSWVLLTCEMNLDKLIRTSDWVACRGGDKPDSAGPSSAWSGRWDLRVCALLIWLYPFQLYVCNKSRHRAVIYDAREIKIIVQPARHLASFFFSPSWNFFHGWCMALTSSAGLTPHGAPLEEGMDGPRWMLYRLSSGSDGHFGLELCQLPSQILTGPGQVSLASIPNLDERIRLETSQCSSYMGTLVAITKNLQ